MTDKSYRSEKEFRAIMDGLAESVVEASDAEILEETREAGEDIEESADRLRARLLETVKAFRQRHLVTARTDYAKAVQSVKRTVVSLPQTSRERRALLDAVLARRPDLGKLLTAQYRDLNALDDEDLEGCLRHLGALGVLDEYIGDAGR